MKKLLLLMALLSAPAYAQNTGALLPALPPSFLNASGAVNANGFICTTQSGTNTNATTYSDSALMSALPNPIQLDANGVPETGGHASTAIYLAPQSYRITLFAPGIGNLCNGTDVGAQIWQRDHVYDFGELIAGGICNPSCTAGGVLFATSTTAVASSPVLLWNSSTQFLQIAGTVSRTGFVIQTSGVPGISLDTTAGVSIIAGAATGGVFPLSVSNGVGTGLMEIDGNGSMFVGSNFQWNNTTDHLAVNGSATLTGSAGSLVFTSGGTTTIQTSSGFLPLVVLNTNGTAGNNFGLEVQGGSNASDYALFVQNHASTTLFYVEGDGKIQMPAIPQTGASGKKVLCWDPATGNIFASSASNICS